jgi:hypothetical protein
MYTLKTKEGVKINTFETMREVYEEVYKIDYNIKNRIDLNNNEIIFVDKNNNQYNSYEYTLSNYKVYYK